MKNIDNVKVSKNFFKSLGTSFAKGIAFAGGFLLTGTMIVYALNYPPSQPSGETSGGKFMEYFTKILVNPNATTDGTVNQAAKLATSRTISGVPFNGTANIAIPWSGITVKPAFAANSTTAGRVRMYEVGCESSRGTSCDANTNGRVDNADNADTVDGYHLNQNVTSGSNPQWGTTYANNWFRSQGATGWYNETYGGGWYMNDTTWLRAYNNKSIYTPANLQVDGNADVGSIRVGFGTHTYITLEDDESPNGVKYIHANSNHIGFLSGAGSWLSRWDNSGNQVNVGNITAPKVTTPELCLNGSCKTSWPSGGITSLGQNNCYNIQIVCNGSKKCAAGYYVAGYYESDVCGHRTDTYPICCQP